MEGWLKLHRKILGSMIFDNPEHLKVWIWMLSKASHKEHQQLVGHQIVNLQVGQFVFGRNVAAEALKMSESKVYRILNVLEKANMITVDSNNKFSLVTIVNWGFYQNSDENTNSNWSAKELLMNGERTSKEHQVDTNKNDKNEKKEKNEKKGENNMIRAADLEEYYPLDEKLNKAVLEYIDFRKESEAPMTDKAIQVMIKKLDDMTNDNNEKIEILEQSIIGGYKGIFPVIKARNTGVAGEENIFLKFVEEL